MGPPMDTSWEGRSVAQFDNFPASYSLTSYLSGNVNWTNPNYAVGDNNNYAYGALGTDTLIDDIGVFYVALVGPMGTSSEKNNSTASSDTTLTLGGSSDLWGKSISQSDIESSSFGVRIRAQGLGGANKTHYLNLTNCSFDDDITALGDNIEVDGVEVKLRCGFVVTGRAPLPLSYTVRVFSAEVVVYYTIAGTTGSITFMFDEVS